MGNNERNSLNSQLYIRRMLIGMKPLIIVCGLGSTGYKIYSLLQQQGAEVLGISNRPITLQNQEKVIIGDPRSPAILVKAGIRKAHTLVLATDDDAFNLAILTQAKVLNPQIRIINRLLNQTLGETKLLQL